MCKRVCFWKGRPDRSSKTSEARIGGAMGMILLFILSAASFDASASSALGLTGRTLKQTGAGCGTCHTGTQTATVTITGPATLYPGQVGSYTVTNALGIATAGLKMGVNVASSDGTLSVIAANLVVNGINGEISHTTVSNTVSLALTNAVGTASYSFRYEMPIGAANGSSHLIYATSRIKIDGAWNHATTFTVTSQKLNQAALTALFNASAAPAPILFGASGPLSTSGGSGTGAVSYSSNNPSVCSIAGTTLIAAGVGSCIITATKATDTTYNAASDTFTLTVNKATQATLNAFANPTTVPYQATSALSTTGGSGGGAVTYASNNGNCTIVSATLTGAIVGSCIVTATKATDANYNAATGTVNVTVAQAGQTISFGTLPNKFTNSPPFTVSASGGVSGNPVMFAASGVCTSGGVNGSTITLTGAIGTCTVNANQAGNTNYAAATQVSQSFAVTPPNSFVSVVSRKVHGAAGPFDLPINTSVALAGAVTVEPRVIGAGHLIVFKFSGNVSIAGSAVVSVGTGMVTLVEPVANEVRVTVTGIPNNSRALIALSGVDGAIDAAAPVGFRVGDVNSDRITSSSDVAALKARSGQTTTNAIFAYDINATGIVSAADIAAIKARIDLTPIP